MIKQVWSYDSEDITEINESYLHDELVDEVNKFNKSFYANENDVSIKLRWVNQFTFKLDMNGLNYILTGNNLSFELFEDGNSEFDRRLMVATSPEEYNKDFESDIAKAVIKTLLDIF